MVTHYGNSACEGSSPYQLKMAAPAKVSKKRSNFRIRQFYEKHHFNIAANLTLSTMVSFIILLIARTARIACPDRQTERQNDRQNDKPSTVTLAAHARRGLINYYYTAGMVHVTTSLGLLVSWLHILHCTVVIALENLHVTSFPSYSCLVNMIL